MKETLNLYKNIKVGLFILFTNSSCTWWKIENTKKKVENKNYS